MSQRQHIFLKKKKKTLNKSMINTQFKNNCLKINIYYFFFILLNFRTYKYLIRRINKRKYSFSEIMYNFSYMNYANQYKQYEKYQREWKKEKKKKSVYSLYETPPPPIFNVHFKGEKSAFFTADNTVMFSFSLFHFLVS